MKTEIIRTSVHKMHTIFFDIDIVENIEIYNNIIFDIINSDLECDRIYIDVTSNKGIDYFAMRLGYKWIEIGYSPCDSKIQDGFYGDVLRYDFEREDSIIPITKSLEFANIPMNSIISLEIKYKTIETQTNEK